MTNALESSEWRVVRKHNCQKWMAISPNWESGVVIEGQDEESLRVKVREFCLETAAERLKQPVEELAARLRRTWKVNVMARKVDDADDDSFVGFSLFD